MLIKLRCTKRFEAKNGVKYAYLSGEVGKPILIKEQYQNVSLKETALYLVEVSAMQKDGQAFLAFTVLAEVG